MFRFLMVFLLIVAMLGLYYGQVGFMFGVWMVRVIEQPVSVISMSALAYSYFAQNVALIILSAALLIASLRAYSPCSRSYADLKLALLAAVLYFPVVTLRDNLFMMHELYEPGHSITWAERLISPTRDYCLFGVLSFIGLLIVSSSKAKQALNK